MKRSRFASLMLRLAGALLVSCATQKQVTDMHRRFREVGAADVVLHCTGGDCIVFMQPEYRQHGFLVQLPRKELEAAFEKLGVHRNLAVAVLEWDHRRQNLKEVVAVWRAVLHQHGFKRVVCLQSGQRNQIQGLLILDDSQPPEATALRTAGF